MFQSGGDELMYLIEMNLITYFIIPAAFTIFWIVYTAGKRWVLGETGGEVGGLHLCQKFFPRTGKKKCPFSVRTGVHIPCRTCPQKNYVEY